MSQVYRIAASLGVGSSYKGRRAFTVCFCPKGVGALLAGDGLRSSPEPATSVATDTPRAQVLLPVPGRSSASRTPTPSAEAGFILPNRRDWRVFCSRFR